MTQPATVFATDLWWWIQCKESLNMLGLVCLKMSVFSSLDLRQVFASTTWHIAMPTQGRSIRRWKQKPPQTGQAENSRLAIHSDQFGLSGDYPLDSMLEIANIVILARSSLCSQYTKPDHMKSGCSGSGNAADLACRRLPMLGSFTRRYLCSRDNGSTIFHRLCDASIFGEGGMLFLRMGVGFALSGLGLKATCMKQTTNVWLGRYLFGVVAQVRHVTQITRQETQRHSGHLMQWSPAQKAETERTLLVSHLQAFCSRESEMSDQALMSAVTSSTTACQPVCVEPQLSFADQTCRRVDMAFFHGGTWQASTMKSSP